MEISVDLEGGGHLTVRGAENDGKLINGDVELLDTEGRRWSSTVMTLPEVHRVMDSWQSSGECQAGAFFRVPDLVIVRDAEQDEIIRVFSEMHRTGEHRAEMSPLLAE